MGLAAASGAACAALPEALEDTLYLSGVMSKKNAEYVKQATQIAMLLAMGSWFVAGVSCITNGLLIRIGCPAAKARIVGNTAAFFARVGSNITPTTITATAINYAAGRLGFWAEKRLVQQLTSTAQPQSSVLTC